MTELSDPSLPPLSTHCRHRSSSKRMSYSGEIVEGDDEEEVRKRASRLSRVSSLEGGDYQQRPSSFSRRLAYPRFDRGVSPTSLMDAICDPFHPNMMDHQQQQKKQQQYETFGAPPAVRDLMASFSSSSSSSSEDESSVDGSAAAAPGTPSPKRYRQRILPFIKMVDFAVKFQGLYFVTRATPKESYSNVHSTATVLRLQ
ncbi:unnamed protein product [Cylindrotheca closterium]|uniref:Uncharacterized protein n=1 Tax=Cylindrotheca closterium TaxID=2856 RepID=A0AAD2CL95_9STRA|nr:unnamed protein product [Cylindrotheca closterium]